MQPPKVTPHPYIPIHAVPTRTNEAKDVPWSCEPNKATTRDFEDGPARRVKGCNVLLAPAFACSFGVFRVEPPNAFSAEAVRPRIVFAASRRHRPSEAERRSGGRVRQHPPRGAAIQPARFPISFCRPTPNHGRRHHVACFGHRLGRCSCHTPTGLDLLRLASKIQCGHRSDRCVAQCILVQKNPCRHCRTMGHT